MPSQLGHLHRSIASRLRFTRAFSSTPGPRLFHIINPRKAEIVKGLHAHRAGTSRELLECARELKLGWSGPTSRHTLHGSARRMPVELARAALPLTGPAVHTEKPRVSRTEYRSEQGDSDCYRIAEVKIGSRLVRLNQASAGRRRAGDQQARRCPHSSTEIASRRAASTSEPSVRPYLPVPSCWV